MSSAENGSAGDRGVKDCRNIVTFRQKRSISDGIGRKYGHGNRLIRTAECKLARLMHMFWQGSQASSAESAAVDGVQGVCDMVVSRKINTHTVVVRPIFREGPRPTFWEAAVDNRTILKKFSSPAEVFDFIERRQRSLSRY